MAKDRPTLVQQNKSWEELERLKQEGYLKGRCGVGILNTGESDPFLEACKVHDSEYSTREGSEGPADRKLSSSMWQQVKAEPKFFRRNFLAVRATIYDTLVKIFGPFVW